MKNGCRHQRTQSHIDFFHNWFGDDLRELCDVYSVLLERIARGIMNKVSIKNDLELINSKFGTSYTASDYMYGKGHIKQIVTYISIGEESIAELISNPKLSDAKRTVILDLLSRGLTVDQIKPHTVGRSVYSGTAAI